MEDAIRRKIKKTLAVALLLSFSNAPLAFAQADASASDTQTADAQTAPAPASANQPASPAQNPTGNSPDDSSGSPIASTDDAASEPSIQTASSTDAAAATSSPAPAPADSSSGSAAVNPQDAGAVTVQDASSGQTALAGDSLESTADPQSASSTDPSSILVVPAASSTTDDTATGATTSLPIAPPAPEPAATVFASTSTADVISADVAAATSSDPDAADPSQPSEPHDTRQVIATSSVAIAIPLAALQPSPEYSFALSGSAIPTVATSVAPDGSTRSATIDAALAPVVDNASGAITVSGQCSDDYFVVLLYAHEQDYANDPSSYILNKAYPCALGSFTYSIRDLPHSLPAGTYYLLVGQEGKTGAWKPITSLSPITITRSD